jgi:tetratricopeptide (TPR) repeat protein
MPPILSKKTREKAASDLAFANDLERSGLFDEAEQRYRIVLQSDPKQWRALHQLGSIFLGRGDHVQALEYMAAAMKANPASAEAKSNYGFILQKMDRHEEALDYFSSSLVARPTYAPALLNRGVSLYQLGRLQQALENFERALALEPRNVKALYNRASVLHELRRFDESLAAFEQTLALAPDYAEAQWNEGLTRLLLGDFERGWQQYEWRWKTESQRHQRRDFAQPLWLGGEALAGKIILVHAEQGFGDTLQFVRYLPKLAALGAEVMLEVKPSLRAILSGMNGVARVIVQGEPLPHFDVHCPMMSLPLAFRTTLDTIPADVPYLKAPPDRLQKWGHLSSRQGFRVALAWAGSATHKQDQLRSIPLKELVPLIAGPDGVEWLSVQRELRAGDAELLNKLPNVRSPGEELEDFADTAAVLSHADLVITVDTAVAHLAGALGRPVWLLVQYSPDFRWLLDREDSPWYPTLRIFRQNQLRDWSSVVGRVAEALKSSVRVAT